MSKRVRDRITFSNVVAVLALFFALGGTVYAAGKINGHQVKPKSLPGNRVKPKSLPGNRVKPNTLTSRQINDASLSAVKSAKSLANVTYQTATATLPGGASDPVTTTATCPNGLKVLGGGGVVSDPLNGGFINDTGPTPGHTGWVVHAYSGTATSTITVTAICTSVSATTP